MAKRLEPITPGEILRDEFMVEYGLSQNRLAIALSVPASLINRVINNKYRINADLALRLAAYFGMSAQFWMNLQTTYDLRVAERLDGAKVKKEVKPVQQDQMA